MRAALSTQRTLAASAVLGMLLVGGCGNNNDDAADGDGAQRASAADDDRGVRGEVPKAVPGPSSGLAGAGDGYELGGDLETQSLDAAQLSMTAHNLGEASQEREPGALQEQEIIYQASVSAEADDVEQARFDAIEVMDNYHGTLAADESTTGDDGEMKTVRMAIRVPSEEFDAAYADLRKVGDNVSSRSGSEDVTTEVIDVAARIRAQEQSLARIEALLAQAQRLRTIIAIESQLSRRQADLDSLKSRQAYLEDQTSEATIIMHIERTPEEEEPKEDEDDTGFLAGLSNGWDGLVAATIGIATVIGVLLPFAIVLVLIGVPLVVLVRRLRPANAAPQDG